MNIRLSKIVLLVQALFAGLLLYIGYSLRAARKQEYLEWTHRVTSGQATSADFQKLADRLDDTADRTVIRTLFGLPVKRVHHLELKDGSKLESAKGEYWIYYPNNPPETPESNITPIDENGADKFTGPIPCFIVEFNERGRATAQFATVMHPIAEKPAASK